jgi:flagellar biosynthesis/type III secretory pathway chaperone
MRITLSGGYPVTSDEKEDERSLDEDKALLHQLEQQEREMETEEHSGFSDAESRDHIEDRIRELDDEIVRLKQRPARGEG